MAVKMNKLSKMNTEVCVNTDNSQKLIETKKAGKEHPYDTTQ